MISKILHMRRGTKVGWLLVGVAILLSLWVVIAQSVGAAESDFTYSDNSRTAITGYTGTPANGIVEIPAKVTSIGSGVFRNSPTAAESMTSVNLTQDISSIGEGAFMGCERLTNVGNMHITTVPSILSNTFKECISLGSITLPDSVRFINANAFENCIALESCDLPYAAVVDPTAFSGCINLREYRIKNGVGSANYQVYAGNLYSLDGSRLLRVAPGMTEDKMSFLPTCSTIDEGAFSANIMIKKLTIPNTVRTIANNAFNGCAIEEITIPVSVTSIGSAQGSWTQGKLKRVFGIEDSPAASFAYNASVIFETIGGTAENITPDVNPDNNANINNNVIPNNTIPNSGANVVVPNTGIQDSILDEIPNNIIAPGTVVDGSGSGATVNGKDQTPKTADGDIDARWFLIIGVFFAGLAVIFYSRTRKFQYVSRKNESDLDS